MSLLFPGGFLLADEEVRKAQEELRKRHLFYGEMTGQPSEALTRAIEHYQRTKGFTCTGYLDSETSASLGIIKTARTPTETPYVVADTGDLRGANGETLPGFVVFRPPTGQRVVPLQLATTEHQQIALSLPRHDTALIAREPRPVARSSRAPTRRIRPRKETNPLVLAFNSVNHAMKRLAGEAPSRRERLRTKRRN